jgi:hypothetical protein
LRFKNFDTNLKDAHIEYTEYCSTNNIKASCKIEFNKRLETYKITSFKSGNFHNKFNFKHAKLEEIALSNKWKHSTDQYDNGDQFDDSQLDNGVSKDLEEKDAEIKALREQIEILQNKLAVSPLDVNIEVKEEEAIIAPPFVIDPYKILMQELEDNKIWIEEILRMTKPKKKLNKKQIQRDIFEIDFMCD